MSEPTLEDISAAMMAADGMTPAPVLAAFLPRIEKHLGQQLVPLRAGHELFLGQIDHPLATGRAWEDVDVLMALFVFSRQSRDLFVMVNDDSFEARFFEFLDAIPTTDVAKLGEAMVSHYTSQRTTAIAMSNPHSAAQKKTADSGGSLPRSAGHAPFTDGLRTWLSTTFRWLKSSP